VKEVVLQGGVFDIANVASHKFVLLFPEALDKRWFSPYYPA
jgi:hypothetical protein